MSFGGRTIRPTEILVKLRSFELNLCSPIEPFLSIFQTLSYDVGHQWDRCFWYWYDHPNSYSYCSFDMDSKGSVKQHKCKPAALVRDLVCPLVGN